MRRLHPHALRLRRVSSVSILVMSATTLASAQKPFEYYAQRYDWSHTEPYIRIEQIDIGISPEKPQFREEIAVKARVTSPEDVFNLATVFEPYAGARLGRARKEEFCVAHYRHNETRECSTSIRFGSFPAVLQVRVTGRIKTSDGVEIPVEGMRGFRLAASEGDAGEGAADVEFFQDPWQDFDPLTGERQPVDPVVADVNRRWIKEARMFGRSITDLEALYLYRDALLYFVEPADESLFLHEDTGWKLARGGAEALLNKGWRKGFRMEDRTYATNTRERIEKHLSWLKQGWLGGYDEDFHTLETIRKLEEYYGEEWVTVDEPTGKEPPERAPDGSLEARLDMDRAPRLGETAQVTLTVASYWDFPKVEIGAGVGRGIGRPGIEIVSWPEGCVIERRPTGDGWTVYSRLQRNERRTYEFTVRATSEGEKHISGGAQELAPVYRMTLGGDSIYLEVGKTRTRVSRCRLSEPRRKETPSEIKRRGEARRNRRFAVIIAITVVELLLLAFITQKLPVRRRRKRLGI